MMADRPNFVRLGGGYYLTRTQAGFKQAAKAWAGDQYKELSERGITGFPVSYPAVCSFGTEYQGYFSMHASCCTVREFRETLAHIAAALDENDPHTAR